MYHHPITKEKLDFNSKEEFVQFLQKCNPQMVRNMEKQYQSKYPEYFFYDFGLKVEIRKIKNK